MNMKPKAPKFRIRREAGATARSHSDDMSFAPGNDGFGDEAFPGSAKEAADKVAGEEGISEIRREGLTGRQLRMARRLAQKNGLAPKSDFDAVRLLRAQGIDPFDRANMLELVAAKPNSKRTNSAQSPTAHTQRPRSKPSASQKSAQTSKTGSIIKNLPQKVDEEAKLPGAHDPDAGFHAHELERIQRDIVRRRRRNLVFLASRLSVFVFLPTLLAGLYFAFVATPSYATKSEFIVQQADTMGASPGLLGGTSMATSQDSIMVQDFLTSREALGKLNVDHDYRGHFSNENVDVIQRLPSDASNEDVYAHYQNNVTVGYDPTEGVLRMEVSALSPEMSRIFSEALIGYAEARVDSVTERKRADQMRGSSESFESAEARMVEAQERVLQLQEQLGVLDPASETTALMSQISNFEIQVAEKRLQLQQLLDNTEPNAARVAGVEGDIGRLEDLIAELRLQMTSQIGTQGSLASISAQLRMAEVDLETRTFMMQESLQSMEAARIEAMRQVRFLSIGVAPIPPDEPTYPRVFENTLITLLIFSAIYLLVSLTAAVLREQVSN
ncbi:MAG: capsule biosynthesis protein [Boseongicola sp.]|nr:capsule biosynthesis protein [Boseongicola sp.]